MRRTAVDIREAIELNIGDSGWQLDYFCLQLGHDTRSRGKTRDFSPIELQAGLSDRRYLRPAISRHRNRRNRHPKLGPLALGGRRT